MANMMRRGYAALAGRGLAHIAAGKGDACLEVGCGGANVKRLRKKGGLGIGWPRVAAHKKPETQSARKIKRHPRGYAIMYAKTLKRRTSDGYMARADSRNCG